jgi:hypothetical protein
LQTKPIDNFKRELSMKITDPDVIKNWENDLIESVKADLDLDVVKDIIKNRMASAALTSRGGEIIVHNNEIAFRLDFDIHLSGSLMFDRQGSYIPELNETEDPDNVLSEDPDLDDMDDTQEKNELDLNLPDYGLDDPDQLPADPEPEPEPEPDPEPEPEPEIENSDASGDSLIEDDMNDILKESREFWELKKDS